MKKKILFITHQLTRTGAPIVMMDAVRILKDAGCEIHMISMDEGELRADVEALGIDITIRKEFMEDWKSFLEPIWNYDLVFVNTIVPLQTIHLLNLAHMQVIWWIHEPEIYFDVYGQWLPDFSSLKPHIHVWAVSPVVQEIIKRRCGYEAELVPFGIADVAETGSVQSDDAGRNSRHPTDTTPTDGSSTDSYLTQVHDDSAQQTVTFLTIGVYCKRKGQDLLQKAIASLPEDLRTKCRFLFCGNQTDVEPDVYEPLKEFAAHTENVELLPEMSHDEMLRTIKQADYLLIPSRQEPMPTVAAESMMLSVPCVISDVCGVAKYLKHGESGIIFKSDDIGALSQAIQEAISLRRERPEDYHKMCKAARTVYEESFSFDQFREHLLQMTDEKAN